ncbi:hypothetical protein I3843_10G090800 [Carya illinoinensis]|nr:hypothetical protein I3843_10G090800 [Carya illinoinensis]
MQYTSAKLSLPSETTRGSMHISIAVALTKPSSAVLSSLHTVCPYRSETFFIRFTVNLFPPRPPLRISNRPNSVSLHLHSLPQDLPHSSPSPTPLFFWDKNEASAAPFTVNCHLQESATGVRATLNNKTPVTLPH